MGTMSIPDIYSAPLTGFTVPEMSRLAELDPKLFADVARRLEFEQLELDRETYEDSLIAFYERAWREIDPAQLSINWHHERIAEHLEDITFGRERSLIANVPPRHTKSLLVNVMWPAWVWAQPLERKGPLSGPHVKFLSVSYAATLAEEMGLKMLRLITGEWYQSLWGSRVRIMDDQQSRANFGNAAGGERISNSIEGGILGRGGDCVSGDSVVKTPRGKIIVKHLSTNAETEYILSYDFVRKTSAYRRLIAVARRCTNTVWRVYTRNGRVVETTGEHPILTQRGWIQAMALVVGDVLLCSMWDDDYSARGRNGEVVSKQEARAVLQPQLYDGCEERPSGETAATMQGMSANLALQGYASEPLLQRRMQKGCVASVWRAPEDDQVAPVRYLQARLPTVNEQDARSVLLDYVQKYRPFPADEGEKQPSIPAWEGKSVRLVQGMVLGQEGNLGARWPQMCGVREDGICGGPSHQFDSNGSSPSEFGVSLQGVPRGAACGSEIETEEDIVSLVEQICREEDVYDLQIEGTHCFFANGVLVHNCTIIDDPQTRKGADSPAERAASLRGMSDLTTRVTDPRIHAQVLIMQRLNMQDATDWALKNWPRNTVHLMFPARFDPDRACPGDPRTFAGELLWPEVWTNEELLKIEAGLAALDGDVLSDYAVEGQLQQNPKPRGGGIINDEDWGVWPEWTPKAEDMTFASDGSSFIPLPPVSHVILSLDTAISEKETADWNACVVLGVWHRPNKLVTIVGTEDQIDDGEQPRIIIMGGWRRRCKLNDEGKGRDGRPLGLVQLVHDTCRRFPVDRIIIEDKTRGTDVRNELQRQFAHENYNIQMFDPKKHGDKVARLYSVQPLFSQNLVYMPGKCVLTQDYRGNEVVEVQEFDWARAIMDEVAQVPNGPHDDYADGLSMGCIQLRNDGLITLTQEYVRQQVAMRMQRTKRNSVRNSYGV